jgi:hypothetical protein
MLNSLLRRNKPPRNGSSMSKWLSFDGSNEPAVATVKAVDLLNNLRELLAARDIFHSVRLRVPPPRPPSGISANLVPLVHDKAAPFALLPHPPI